ncbi:MAG: hypothetical protein WD712_00060 [Candidatus Spechtbacterales bacterium]
MAQKNIIKADSRDELTSIIDKVLTHEADSVLLEVSDNAYIAQNILNFRLLKREAETAGKKITVISENPRIQALAARAGLRIQDRIREFQSVNTDNKQGHRPGLISENSREVIDIMHPDKARSLKDEDGKNAPSSGGLKKLFKKDSAKKEPPNLEPEFVPFGKYEPMNDIAGQPAEKPGLFKRISLPAFTKPRLGIIGSVAGIFRRSVTASPAKSAAVAVALLGLAGVLFLALGVLPKATVILYPKTLQDSMNFSLVADSNVSTEDYAKGIVPAQILEERQENNFTFEATGTAQLEERAAGHIRVYNEYSSLPQTLVESTRFLSANGKLFRTTQTVVIPGAEIEGGQIVASSIIVPVVADEAGADYNISPTTFSIPGFSGTDKYTKFYGKNEQGFEGGFKGKAIVVTAEDINKAEEKIESEFLAGAETALREKIPENLMILEDSLESGIETLEFSNAAGEPTETFTARAVVFARIFLIREGDISESIGYNFINSTQYGKEFELSDTRKVEYSVKEVDYKTGYAEFAVSVQQLFVRKVDASLILSDIKGRDEVEVRKILSNMEELEKAQLRFWPFWVSKIPADEGDITVEVQYSKELSG